MAQLGGKGIKTLVTSLEVQSDDGGHVLMIDPQGEGSGVLVRIRRPWESAWSPSGPKFTITARDAGIIASTFANHDVSYSRSQLDEIPREDFTGENPEPTPESVRDEEARCTELDIERAKAENLREERELLNLQNERDHALDKHVGADVPGCPACDRKYPADGPDPERAAAMLDYAASLAMERATEDDTEDEPF